MKRALLLTVSMIATAFSLYTAIEVHRLKQSRHKQAPAAPVSGQRPAAITAQDNSAPDRSDVPDYTLPDSLAEPRGFYNEDASLQRIPVLCYHRIARNQRDNYYSTREAYLWQMQYLKKHHNVISTAHLVNWIRYKQGLSSTPVTMPEKAVVIQFDDNYRSVYSQVFPIMKRLGLKWTFFIYKHHHRPNPISHLKEMARAGVDIQSHTMTHPWFHKPAKGQSMKAYIREMHWQIGGSRKFLEKLSGRPVLYLAYPFGTYSDLAVSLCRKYGYRAMFAADGGYASEKSPLYAVERILVTKGWSKSYFKKIVNGEIRFRRMFKPTKLLDRNLPL